MSVGKEMSKTPDSTETTGDTSYENVAKQRPVSPVQIKMPSMKVKLFCVISRKARMTVS